MLTFVATPIGNLEDLSLRAARLMLGADILLTEDTRVTQTLLSYAKEHFDFPHNPSQRMISYFKEVEFVKLAKVLESLNNEQNVVLVSDAGMPVVSDPGGLLAKTCNSRGIKYTVVPGPTSVEAALILSGFTFDEFMFYGFLPKKETDLVKVFSKFAKTAELYDDLVFVVFESPLRVAQSCKLLLQLYPKIQIKLIREITKKFEEVISVGAETDLTNVKGEIVLCIKF